MERNRRITTGIIRARAIDNRIVYTTHTILFRQHGKFSAFWSLDTFPDSMPKLYKA